MYKKVFLSLFMLVTFAFSTAFAENAEVFTISAYGEGEVASLPDMASVVLSVKTEANNAKTAQENNAKIANKVISAIKAFGINDRDIKTSRYSIYPKYDNVNHKIMGYSAQNSVIVKIHGVDKVGAVIDSALSAGANQVSSVNFGISNTKSLENEALVRAVKNAREQAEIVARALNVNIVGIKHASPNVRHQSFEAAPPMLMKAAANRADMSTPVEGGEVSVTASVNVEFIIK